MKKLVVSILTILLSTTAFAKTNQFDLAAVSVLKHTLEARQLSASLILRVDGRPQIASAYEIVSPNSLIPSAVLETMERTVNGQASDDPNSKIKFECKEHYLFSGVLSGVFGKPGHCKLSVATHADPADPSSQEQRAVVIFDVQLGKAAGHNFWPIAVKDNKATMTVYASQEEENQQVQVIEETPAP